jgi:hypothetical protein
MSQNVRQMRTKSENDASLWNVWRSAIKMPSRPYVAFNLAVAVPYLCRLVAQIWRSLRSLP